MGMPIDESGDNGSPSGIEHGPPLAPRPSLRSSTHERYAAVLDENRFGFGLPGVERHRSSVDDQQVLPEGLGRGLARKVVRAREGETSAERRSGK
jgi:hypothetical protein